MDLRLTPEQEQLRETLRRLFDRHLSALEQRLPEPPAPDTDRVLADAHAVGLLALGLPEPVGGVGDFEDLTLAHEELGRGLAPSLLTSLTLAGRLLLRTEAADRVDGPLAQLAGGTRRLTTAVEDATSATRATATTSGDGIRVDGHQRWVTDGPDVDDVLVLAHGTDTGSPVVVAVPVDAPGVRWVAEQRASDVPHWTLRLDGVSVGGDRLLRIAPTDGLGAYRREAQVLAAARAVGGGRAVLERTVSYVRTREQFDRPIGTFQAVQHALADVATQLDAAALAVAQVASAVQQRATGSEVARVAAVAALAAHDSFRHATLVAHQLHGGMGFVLDSPLHLWSARAVGDPTLLQARRHLLDQLADAGGLTADAVSVARDHRLAPA